MLSFFQVLFNKRELPNFIIIGAQKCGTTALHNYPAKHPQLAAPQKEIRFFNSDNKYRLGKDFIINTLPMYLLHQEIYASIHLLAIFQIPIVQNGSINTIKTLR